MKKINLLFLSSQPLNLKTLVCNFLVVFICNVYSPLAFAELSQETTKVVKREISIPNVELDKACKKVKSEDLKECLKFIEAIKKEKSRQTK